MKEDLCIGSAPADEDRAKLGTREMPEPKAAPKRKRRKQPEAP